VERRATARNGSGMRRAIRALTLCLVFASEAAYSASPPLPPRRPMNLGSPKAPPNQPIESSPTDDSSKACLARLADLEVEYEPMAQQQDEACIVETPVRLRRLADSRNPISFPDRPLVDCRLAERLADWLRETVSPLFRARLGSSLRAVATGVGYECRPRNREPGSKLSAHGLGLALDISAFELTDRQRLRIGTSDDPVAEDALDVVRKSACGWFTTVLGPGSQDNLHETHLHVDMQVHGSREGYTICQ
jgi:hypothetical protein